MHEMGIAQGVLAVALDAAAGEKIRRICLRIGKRQMVARDSLEFSFRLIAEGTPAASAGVDIDEVPIALRCRRCGAAAEIELPPWNCRQCGSDEVEVLAGDDLLVDAVELENGTVIRRAAKPPE